MCGNIPVSFLLASTRMSYDEKDEANLKHYASEKKKCLLAPWRETHVWLPLPRLKHFCLLRSAKVFLEK